MYFVLRDTLLFFKQTQEKHKNKFITWYGCSLTSRISVILLAVSKMHLKTIKVYNEYRFKYSQIFVIEN